ncbi:Scr1 family TA system antitoxin-like transcriptional regulator [Nocardiopsis aegyptia]|uniref:Scr1 family TA system antitoxin-like transcriptional regulator n=1 Tax=Nocardiopsis aegyptia TaxID=220378 RepID=UPI003671C21F
MPHQKHIPRSLYPCLLSAGKHRDDRSARRDSGQRTVASAPTGHGRADRVEDAPSGPFGHLCEAGRGELVGHLLSGGGRRCIRAKQPRGERPLPRPDLRIQILPDAAGLHAAVAGGGFTILDFAEDSGLVYTETAATERVHDDGDDTEAFDLVYQYVSASALGIQESVQFLESLTS